MANYIQFKVQRRQKCVPHRKKLQISSEEIELKEAEITNVHVVGSSN